MPKKFKRPIGGVEYCRLYEDQSDFISSESEMNGGQLVDIMRKLVDIGIDKKCEEKGFSSREKYLQSIRENV